MSVEFTLSDCTLDCAQWNGLLGEWAKAQGDDLYDAPELDVKDEEPTILVWGQGSVRGALLRLEKDGREVTVRFNVLASRKDWERGFEILNRALAKGGGRIERETGEPYTLEKLTRDQAHQEAVEDFVAGMRSVSASAQAAEEKRVLLPLAGFNLPVSTEQLTACTKENQAAVETALAVRVEKYGRAFRGHVFLMKNKTQITTWTLIPTIVGKVDYVAINWKELCVPLARLLEILGDRVDPLGNNAWYLPELDRERDLALLEALEKEHVDPKDAQPGHADEDGAAEEGEEQLVQLVKQMTMLLVTSMLQGGQFEDAKKKLVEAGLEAGLADAITGATAMALKGLVEDRLEPKAVVAQLAEQGVPVPLAVAIIEGLAECLGKQAEK